MAAFLPPLGRWPRGSPPHQAVAPRPPPHQAAVPDSSLASPVRALRMALFAPIPPPPPLVPAERASLRQATSGLSSRASIRAGPVDPAILSRPQGGDRLVGATPPPTREGRPPGSTSPPSWPDLYCTVHTHRSDRTAPSTASPDLCDHRPSFLTDGGRPPGRPELRAPRRDSKSPDDWLCRAGSPP